MDKKLVRGAELSESKIDKVLKAIPKWHWKKIVDSYWEWVPEGDYSEKEKMEFVLCAIPMVGIHPIELLKAQLLEGPLWVNGRDCPNAKPNILKRIKRCKGGDEVLKAMANDMRQHKHVPERIKTDEWLQLLELMCVIDEEQTHGGSTMYDTSVGREYSDEDWMNACKRFVAKSNKAFGS